MLKSKWIQRTVILVAGLAMAASQAHAAAVGIMYHRFGEDDVPSTNIRLEQFEAHLATLEANDTPIVTLPDVVTGLRTGTPLQQGAVTISIDDAAASVFTEAWPRFRDRGMPFTLFVSTGQVDAGGGRVMTWDQIRTLHEAGVTIGCHGHTHQSMVTMTADEIRTDLQTCLDRMEDELGFRPALLAWPYGEANPEALALARELGFKAAFGQHSGPMGAGHDLYYLPRYPLNEAYGTQERFDRIRRSLPLPVLDITPQDVFLDQPAENPPAFGFTLADDVSPLLAKTLACYPSNGATVDMQRMGARVEVRLDKPFGPGRGRINCTAGPVLGQWLWFGTQFVVPGGTYD